MQTLHNTVVQVVEIPIAFHTALSYVLSWKFLFINHVVTTDQVMLLKARGADILEY